MFLLLINNQAPQQQNISQIEFATSTRGYHKNIIITTVMMVITQQSRNDVSEHTIKSKITKRDWNELRKALKNISMEEIPALASPTMQRASDAARTSTLSIIDTMGKRYTHTFDNEDPNEKLKPLMKSIITMEQHAEVSK